MMAMEEQFELELDEEQAEKIATVQEAADLIAQQVRPRTGTLGTRLHVYGCCSSLAKRCCVL